MTSVFRRFTAVLLLSALCACQGAPRFDPPAWRLQQGPTLPDVRVADAALHGAAFAAEAAFLFPDQSRALVHALLRSEFARLEARRMGLMVDATELQAALQGSIATIESGLNPPANLESWAQARYGRNWAEVQDVLRAHLANNQLYQQCARAYALQEGRVILQMLTTRDAQTARDWARQLASGASIQSLAAASLDPGPLGDGSLPPLPRTLPGPLGVPLISGSARVGQVIGPFQFAGDLVWRVARVRELLPKQGSLPPTGVLLQSLRQQPVSPLEEQAWFEAMSSRYTAVENLPAFQAPAAVFVRRSP